MMKRALILAIGTITILALCSSTIAQGYMEVWTGYSYSDEFQRCQGNGYSIDVTVTNHWGLSIEIEEIRAQMDWQAAGEYHSDSAIIWLNDGQSHSTSLFINIPEDAYVGNHMYQIEVEYNVYDVNDTYSESWSGEWFDFYVESASYQEATNKRQEATEDINELNSIMFESPDAADKAMQATDAFSMGEGHYMSGNWDMAISEYSNAIGLAAEAIALEDGYDPGGPGGNGGNGDGSGDGEGEGGDSIFGDGGITFDWESLDNGIPSGTIAVLFIILIIGICVIIPVVYYLERR